MEGGVEGEGEAFVAVDVGGLVREEEGVQERAVRQEVFAQARELMELRVVEESRGDAEEERRRTFLGSPRRQMVTLSRVPQYGAQERRARTFSERT